MAWEEGQQQRGRWREWGLGGRERLGRVGPGLGVQWYILNLDGQDIQCRSASVPTSKCKPFTFQVRPHLGKAGSQEVAESRNLRIPSLRGLKECSVSSGFSGVFLGRKAEGGAHQLLGPLPSEPPPRSLLDLVSFLFALNRLPCSYHQGPAVNLMTWLIQGKATLSLLWGKSCTRRW